LIFQLNPSGTVLDLLVSSTCLLAVKRYTFGDYPKQNERERRLNWEALFALPCCPLQMLRAITIQNFLSFRQKKVLYVRDGKLVIVGEDGAGKTNFNRAVQFTLQTEPIRWSEQLHHSWNYDEEFDVNVEADMLPEDTVQN
jgi:hypothetical protein